MFLDTLKSLLLGLHVYVIQGLVWYQVIMLWTVQQWATRLVVSVTQSFQITVHSGLNDDEGKNN